MRGIAGIINRPGAPAGQDDDIQKVLSRMAVGQPARKHFVSNGAASFAHVLWVTSPEDRFESQPLQDSTGTRMLVTDAFLENRDELATAFGWSRSECATRPDSAFVLAAYDKWGEACVRRLEGQWAFAIWDERRRRLFAAVDVFSCRPFYYARTDQGFAFASTLRPLLSLPGISLDVHHGVIADFLLHAPRHRGQTLYRSISRLPAAHSLTLTDDGCTLSRYWQADPSQAPTLHSDDEYREAFRHELDRAVSSALRVHDGRVGIMVSGGLDSSAITAIAGRSLAERGLRLQALHQLPPADDPRRVTLRETDESGYVRRLQSALPHVDFHFLPRPDRQISLSAWDAFFDQHSVPTRSPMFTKESPLEMAARELGLRRVLYGSGGNYSVSLEVNGCPYFMELAVDQNWPRLERELSAFAGFYAMGARTLLKEQILQRLLPMNQRRNERHALWWQAFGPDLRRHTSLDTQWRRRWPWPWKLRDFSVRRHIAWTMNDLMPQEGAITPAVLDDTYPFEGFSPFLNRRLNELCMTIPLHLQINRGRDRLLVRGAVASMLPHDLLWRRTRGLRTPYAWPNAWALVKILPEALAELERSALVSSFVELSFLRRIAKEGDSLIRRLGPTQFVSLFNVAWFLHWLERQRKN